MDPGSLEPVMRRRFAPTGRLTWRGRRNTRRRFKAALRGARIAGLKPMEGCGEQGEEATEAQGKWNISFKFLVRERRRVER